MVQLRRRLMQIAAYGAGVAVWEIAVTQFGFGRGRLGGPGLLPAPSGIVGALIENFFAYYNIAKSTIITLQEVFLGFFVAVLLGIGLSMALAANDTIKDMIFPGLMLLQTIPKSAIAPLFVLWFGYGMYSKIMLTFLMSFFPILVNSLLGLTSVEPELLDLLRVMRCPLHKVFLKVRIPNSLPYTLAAFRIAIPIAVIGAIIGEFIAAEAGLGWIILNATYQLNINLVFACLLFLFFLAMTLILVVMVLERKLIPWHVTRRITAQRGIT